MSPGSQESRMTSLCHSNETHMPHLAPLSPYEDNDFDQGQNVSSMIGMVER